MAGENKKDKDKELLYLSLFTYFDMMEISSEEKKFRTAIAEYLTLKIFDIFERFEANKNNVYGFRQGMIKTFISWILFTRLLNEDNLGEYKTYIKKTYGIDLASVELIPEVDVSIDSGILGAAAIMMIIDKLEDVANEIVDSTLRNIDDETILSIDRAERIARDEANRFPNMIAYETAKEQGYQYHVWHTMEDKRVRKSHASANNQKKPIDEPFVIGESLMRFPMDDYYGADIKEIISCRCSVSYE